MPRCTLSKNNAILQQTNLCGFVEKLKSSDFIFRFLDSPHIFHVFVFMLYLLVSTAISVVRGKGHVLMFHGGGCTPFTQVNDTHLHAQLAALLIQIENQWSLNERERFQSLGQNKTPTMTRTEILSIVQAAWQCIDHARVAEKGYKQSGPTMPLTGPVAPEDVFGDLLRVMDTIDGSTASEVGMTLRDKAVAFVKDGAAKNKWVGWGDCHKLIEEHDGLDEAAEEGMEAFGVLAEEGNEESESEAAEDAESEDYDDDPDGDFDGLPAKGSDELQLDATDPEIGPGDAPAEDCVVVESGHSEGSEAKEVAAARQLLYDDAVRSRDDKMVKIMRTAMREETRDKKEANTEVGIHLRKRAQDQMCEDAKRRKEIAAENKLAAMDLEEVQVRKAKEQRATQEAHCRRLQLLILERRENEKRKRAEALERAQQRWLQTQYAPIMAKRCTKFFVKMSVFSKTQFGKVIANEIVNGTFNRQLYIGDLWISDKTLSVEWSTVHGFSDGRVRHVRCSLPFQEFLDNSVPAKMRTNGLVGPCPVDTLLRLFNACVPHANRVFQGPYTPLRLLHKTDYVMDMAFVYGILALSKWIGEETYPCGVYGHWPPKFPANLMPDPVPVDALIPVDDDADLTPS